MSKHSVALGVVMTYLLVSSIWNFREDWLPLLPERLTSVILNQETGAVAPDLSPFSDPDDPLPEGVEKMDVSDMPVLDRAQLAQFAPDSIEGHEFLSDYMRFNTGIDPQGEYRLQLPKNLGWLSAIYALEWHVDGEGFDVGYFGNYQADGIRFAQEGYRMLGFPELADILADAETYFVAHRDRYLPSDSGDVLHQLIPTEHHSPHHDFDQRWSDAFKYKQVYSRRYDYIMKNWRSFSPETSSDSPIKGDSSHD